MSSRIWVQFHCSSRTNNPKNTNENNLAAVTGVQRETGTNPAQS